jgi:hypothetical protein
MTSFSINSCQKLCLSVTDPCGSYTTFTWTTSTPSLVSISYNNGNAIITSLPFVSGTAIVNVNDSVGNLLLTFTINITNYTALSFPVTNTQFLTSTFVTSSTLPSSQTLTIAGPFNTYANPNTSGLCFFVFNNIVQGAGFINGIICTNFLPGSTSSSLQVITTTNSGPNAKVALMMLEPNTGSATDPLFPLATSLTNVPFIGTDTQSIYLSQVLPCLPSGYMCFVQINGTYTSNVFVYGNTFDTSGGFFNIEISTLGYNTLSTSQTSYNLSVFFCPIGYYNLSSTSLIWSNQITVTIIGSSSNTSVTVYLPTGISIPLANNVLWFAQPATIATVVNGTSTVIGVVQIFTVVQTSSTTLSMQLTCNSTTNVSIPINFFAIANNNAAGFSIT